MAGKRKRSAAEPKAEVALETKPGLPPKTPGNASVPPSRGQKTDRPPR